MNEDDAYLLLSGSSHPVLAEEVANCLGVSLGKVLLSEFPDREIQVQVLDSVRGKDVFVLQTIALDPNRYLMELLLIIDALKRASAKSVTAVIPFFGYARQDRKDRSRVPITAKLVANLLETAGVSRVLTLDLHAGQLQGFFDVPVDNLTARSVLVDAVNKLQLENMVVVAPDAGSIKMARDYAAHMGVDYAVVDKIRRGPADVVNTTVIGNIEGHNILLADDICSTAGTLVSAAKACREKGASRVVVAVTHGLLVGDAVAKLQEGPIEALVMSNTIPVTDRLKGSTKIHTVSVAPLLSKAIRCIQSAESMQPLFK